MTMNHLLSEIPEAGMGVANMGLIFFFFFVQRFFFAFTSRKCQKAREPVLFKLTAHAPLPFVNLLLFNLLERAD